MRFKVDHLTRYLYDAPVRLGPHRLRLRPREDEGIGVVDHALEIAPAPAGTSQSLDPDGNLVTVVWFEGIATELSVRSRFEVLTGRTNPYGFLPEPANWPAPYSLPLARRLSPWLTQAEPGDAVRGLADSLRADTRDAFEFVQVLNQWLHREIAREIREHGAAQSPDETLRLRRGACRDLAVLFIAVCRSQGLAARFVSGYQKARDPAVPPSDGSAVRRYMHAWPEVYLPGGGWRGFDPTHGLAIADAHVALAAAAEPADAAPIEGCYYGAARSTIEIELSIEVES
jgi:transglutaminase-like putative cysteine protease